MKRFLGCAFGVACLLMPVAAMPADLTGDKLQCNFYALTAAQRAAQTEAATRQIPGLLGPVQGAMSPVPLDGVYVSDTAIRRKIMAQAIFARRTPNKSIEVLVRVVNCTDYPMQVLGRTSFLDATQFPTEDPSAWQPFFIQPRSIGTYKEVSIGGADVASYLVEFRSNR